MTREEEEARVAEIEAMPRLSAKFRATFREGEERRWALEDAGIPDLMRIKIDRMVAAVDKMYPKE